MNSVNLNESSNNDKSNQIIENLNSHEINLYDNILEKDFEILSQDYDGKHDHVFKIIIIGDSYVGKTSIINKIISGEFSENHSVTLIFESVPFFVKYKDKILKLDVWDTCGQEQFRSLIKSFFTNSSMAIIIYSIDNRSSFESIKEWINQCRNNCSPNTRFILIGNKKDLGM